MIFVNLGPCKCVLIREVSSLRGFKLRDTMCKLGKVSKQHSAYQPVVSEKDLGWAIKGTHIH